MGTRLRKEAVVLGEGSGQADGRAERFGRPGRQAERGATCSSLGCCITLKGNGSHRSGGPTGRVGGVVRWGGS